MCVNEKKTGKKKTHALRPLAVPRQATKREGRRARGAARRVRIHTPHTRAPERITAKKMPVLLGVQCAVCCELAGEDDEAGRKGGRSAGPACASTNAWSAVAKCGHIFHTACLMQALEHKAACPNCRVRDGGREGRAAVGFSCFRQCAPRRFSPRSPVVREPSSHAYATHSIAA